jgi:excisionase family DNA binding protein
MKESLQFIQTTPEQLINATINGVRAEIENLRKEFQPREPEELMTRQETANYFKVDLSTIWAWQKKGKIQGYGIGARVYFKRSEIEQVLTPLT